MKATLPENDVATDGEKNPDRLLHRRKTLTTPGITAERMVALPNPTRVPATVTQNCRKKERKKRETLGLEFVRRYRPHLEKSWSPRSLYECHESAAR
nr:unnamed protein product [Spirometra erinaceieuropaei]